MESICPVCKKNPAIFDPYWGWLPCLPCRTRQSKYSKPKQTVEITTEEIREARVEHKDEIVQPWRGGVLSKEYLRANGTAGIKATPQEIKNAKNVWMENSYYKENE